MKEFFLKHAQSFDPADAIDLLYHKVGNIKELVIKGDPSHLHQLKELSDMIDDYIITTKGHKFEPKEYKSYQQHRPYYKENDYQSRNPYKDDPQMGFYPHYPFYDKYGEYDNRGRGGSQNERNESTGRGR